MPPIKPRDDDTPTRGIALESARLESADDERPTVPDFSALILSECPACKGVGGIEKRVDIGTQYRIQMVRCATCNGKRRVTPDLVADFESRHPKG